MPNGKKVLLEFLNLYVPFKIRLATFDTKHSVTDSTHKINRCFNPEATDSVVKRISISCHRHSSCVR